MQNEFRIDDESYFSIHSKVPSLVSLFGFNPVADEYHYSPINYLLNIPLFEFLPHHPLGFRLFNLLLFLTHCILLYIFLLFLTKNNTLAILASVIFLLHPLNTEVAGQIFLNIILLASIFMQLCLIYFWRFLETSERKYYILSLSFFTVTFLSFETAFLLPFYLFAIIIFFKKFSFRQLVRCILPFLLIAGLFFVLWSTVAAPRAQVVEKFFSFFEHHISLASYCASMTALLSWYSRNFLLGDQVAFMYSIFPLQKNLMLWNLLWMLAVAGLIFLIRYCWHKDLKTFFLFYFLIGLFFFLPASLGHAEMGFVIEPYWFYFSSAGLAFLLAEALLFLKEKISVWAWRIIVFSVLSFFFLQTQNMLSLGKTAKEYYTHWLTISPNNYLALLSFVGLYTQEKDYVQVLYYSQQALKATTGQSYDLLYNIGSIWGGYGRSDLAEEFLRKAIAVSPNEPAAYHRLGEIYLKQGKFDKAIEYFRLALNDDPSFVSSRISLANTLIKLQRVPEAIIVLEDGFMLPNSHLEGRAIGLKLANLYFSEGQFKKVSAVVEKLMADDASESGLLTLAVEFSNEKNVELALMVIDTGINIYPHNKEFYLLQGVILANSNHLGEAIKVWGLGAVIAPDDRRFNDNIMQARMLLKSLL